MDEPVARADERDLTQRGMVELLAHAHVRPPRLERRLAEHVEQGSALLDELEEASVRVQLLGAQLTEQVGGTADVEALLRGDELRERGTQHREEDALALAQALIFEAAPHQRGAEL